MKSNLLSKNSINPGHKELSNKNIVLLSGGVTSFHVGIWALKNLQDPIFYFNDVKWEDDDLYRFNREIQDFLDKKIIVDSDGRDPEQVFYDNKMLGSNRTPICSKVLKAEMLQRFVNPGDNIYMGIGENEIHRAARITPIYAKLGVKTHFPLIDMKCSKKDSFDIVRKTKIEIPRLYKLGFDHNNCGGGCVRAGKAAWKNCLERCPHVYEERERVEKEFTEATNERRSKKDPSYIPRDYHFMKDISLKDFRILCQKQPYLFFSNDGWSGECIGICGSMN